MFTNLNGSIDRAGHVHGVRGGTLHNPQRIAGHKTIDTLLICQPRESDDVGGESGIILCALQERDLCVTR